MKTKPRTAHRRPPMAYIVMVFIVMASIGMAHIVMTYIFMTCIVMAYIVENEASDSTYAVPAEGEYDVLIFLVVRPVA